MRANAQAFTVVGDVTHAGESGRRPAAGRWAVLHRVTVQGGAPLDSTRTDGSGRYRFRLASVDTTAVYLVSTEWDGVGYFSAPVRLIGRPVDTLEALVVYDTSSVGPPIRLIRRLITIVRGQTADGAFDVLEAWSIENPGRTARVTQDTARPVWAVTLPATALQLRIGEGDISPDAVRRRGDAAAVFGTIAPGAIRQLTATYVLPADSRVIEIPLTQWTGQLDLLVEGAGASVSAAGVEAVGTEVIEGRTLQRFVGGPLEPGPAVIVALPRAPPGTRVVVPVIVGVLTLALGAGMWIALHPRAGSARPT